MLIKLTNSSMTTMIVLKNRRKMRLARKKRRAVDFKVTHHQSIGDSKKS
jgi:hypothetical protein